MFVIKLLFLLLVILPQGTYASAGSFESMVRAAEMSSVSAVVDVLQDQEDDTLSVTDPEETIEPVDPELSASDDLPYIYSLVTVSFTAGFLLVLIVLLLSYRYRFPPKQSNAMLILYVSLLLVNCLMFFFPDIFEFNDFMAEASPYFWYGSLSLVIHLLPLLIAFTFDMRRLKRSSKKLVWLSLIPLVLIFTELGYHVEYLMAASAGIALLVLYSLHRANRKKKIGVNYVLTGSLSTFILLILYLLHGEGVVDLQILLSHLVIALIYVILPLSFTLCILSLHISSFSKMKNDLDELTSDLKAADDKLRSQEIRFEDQKKFVSLGRLAIKISPKIKNPLALTTHYSDASIGLIEKVRIELKNSPYAQEESGQHILRLLHKIEENMQNIQKQGTHIGRLVKSMFQQTGKESKEKQLTDLNGLIEEYVHLARQGVQNADKPFDVEIEMSLDNNVGTVPLYTEDFSRVILSLCNNAFDAMRIKMGISDVEQDGHEGNFGPVMRNYKPKLNIETKREDRKVFFEMMYNASDVPSDINHENLHTLFKNRNDDGRAGSGLSEIQDILKAHDSEILILPFGNGTSVHIELKG